MLYRCYLISNKYTEYGIFAWCFDLSEVHSSRVADTPLMSGVGGPT